MTEPQKNPEAIPLTEQPAEEPPAKPKRGRARKQQEAGDPAEVLPVATPVNEDATAAPDVFDNVIADEAARKARREELLSKSHRKHPNLNCIYRDEEAGLRLDREEKRLPGETAPRLLITFSEGKLPNKDETTLLHAEGFRFNGEDKAWWKNSSPANQHIAKIVINKLLEMRGFEAKIAVPNR